MSRKAAKEAFEFPEAWHMPPFFTIQPIEETRQKQLQMWVDLVIRYQKHHGVASIAVESAAESKESELFSNPSIQRRLNLDGVRTVLQAVVREGYGIWVDDGKTVCVTSHRRFQDWANLLYDWVFHPNCFDILV